jgi:hypothetical protein
MGTVKQTIEDAMRELNVLTEGDEADADQIAHGLRQLQGMLAQWSISGLMVPYRARETFSLTNGIAAYNWATGQVAPNFNSPSPSMVLSVSYVLGNYQKPLLQVDDRSLLQMPTTGNPSEPNAFFFNKQTIPQLVLDNPAYGGKVVVVSNKALATDYELTDTLEFPDHYQLLLKNNLAVILAPKYGQSVSAELAFNARDSKATIERYNLQAVPSLRVNVPTGRRYSSLLVR